MANLDEAVSVVLAYLRLAASQGRSSPSTAAESMRSPLRTSPPLSPSPSHTLSLAPLYIDLTTAVPIELSQSDVCQATTYVCLVTFISSFLIFDVLEFPARAGEKTNPGTRPRFGSAPYRLFLSWPIFTADPSSYGTEIEFDTLGVVHSEFAEDLYRSNSPFRTTGRKQTCINHNTRNNVSIT